MENAVDRLAEIISPPAPAGTAVDWEAIARRLRTALPADYLWLLEPGSRSNYDLVEIA